MESTTIVALPSLRLRRTCYKIILATSMLD